MGGAEALRCGDLDGAPFTGAPVEHLALGDQVVHGAGGFEDGRGGVRPVAIVEVEVVDLKAPESAVAGFDHVLAGQAGLVGFVVFAAEKHFAGNEVAAAAPAGFFENGAHDNFGLAIGIGLGVVEEIDAGVVGGVEEAVCDGVTDLFAEGHPGAEGEGGDLQAGFSEGAVEHRGGHGGDRRHPQRIVERRAGRARWAAGRGLTGHETRPRLGGRPAGSDGGSRGCRWTKGAAHGRSANQPCGAQRRAANQSWAAVRSREVNWWLAAIISTVASAPPARRRAARRGG